MVERHVHLLRSSVKEFNQWREMNVGVEPDLSGADLSGLDLRGANLQKANLRGADLSGANLAGCDLSGADLSQVVGAGVDLSRARLMSSTLDRADLGGANLARADLTSASLIRARLQGAVLDSANLYGVVASHAVFQGASMISAKARSAQLDHADFTGARVDQASFYGSDVEGADFSGVELDAARHPPGTGEVEPRRRERRYQKIEIREEERRDEREAEAEFLASKLRLPTEEENKKARINPAKLLLMGVVGILVLVGPIAYDYLGPRTMPIWNLVEIRRLSQEGVTALETAMKKLGERGHLDFDKAAEEALVARRDLVLLKNPLENAEIIRERYGELSYDERTRLIARLEKKAAYAEQDPDFEVRALLISATEKFERVLELDPNNREAKFHLARALYARGQFAAAGKLMRHYLESRPRTIDRKEVVRVGAMAKPMDKESIRVMLRRYPKEGSAKQ